jgi:hypothetical protein
MPTSRLRTSGRFCSVVVPDPVGSNDRASGPRFVPTDSGHGNRRAGRGPGDGVVATHIVRIGGVTSHSVQAGSAAVAGLPSVSASWIALHRVPAVELPWFEAARDEITQQYSDDQGLASVKPTSIA